jgi:hypothetical protein
LVFAASRALQAIAAATMDTIKTTIAQARQ